MISGGTFDYCSCSQYENDHSMEQKNVKDHQPGTNGHLEKGQGGLSRQHSQLYTTFIFTLREVHTSIFVSVTTEDLTGWR